jgi:hypothetical protein
MSIAQTPTLYPDINTMLDKLLSSAQTILGDRFFAMYLYGSLACGNFTPETSDIDFLIVTSEALSDETISELEAMHTGFKASGLKWAKKLEGKYLPKDDLPRFNPNRPPRPTINEGKFYLDGEGSDWIIQRHVIREQGLVLAGPPPKTLIDPILPDELRQSVLGVMYEWWAPMLDKPDFLRGGEYQAYAVLTMCRTLYTLEHGVIASKPVSAHWALDALDGRWRPSIEKSLAWTHATQMDILNETLDFIRYTRDACQRHKNEAK